MRHRLDAVVKPAPVAFRSELAEPMRRALEGMSGTGIGLDYRGEQVLAAYEPVDVLNYGIVAKIDMSEIRAPFIRVSVIAGVFAVVMLALGSMLFFRVGLPILSRMKRYAQDLEQEIEERRQSEARLLTSETALKITIDNSPQGICLADVSGQFLSTNRAYNEMMGYTGEELRQRTIFDLTHPDDCPENRMLFQNMVQGGAPGFDMDKRYVRKDGSIIDVHIHAVATCDDNGVPQYGLAFH